jgi:hypothetical protein
MRGVDFCGGHFERGAERVDDPMLVYMCCMLQVYPSSLIRYALSEYMSFSFFLLS